MIQQYASEVVRKVFFLRYFLTAASGDVDLLPKSLEGNNRDYQKFIILGHQRSGSSMIIGALRTHPEIVAFGELFTANSVGFNVEGYDNYSARIRALRNKYPVDFLDRYIFSSYRDDKKSVGFKIFPEHIEQSDRFRCIWQWLEKNSDLKIIHLTRNNLLAAYASLLVAIKDRRYGIQHESERSTSTIIIDPKKCLEEFQKRKVVHEEAKKYIKNNDVIDVSYEDVAMDPHGYLKKIQSFIGADVRDLEITKVKQETRILSEVISNYDELASAFKGTEWEYLF